MEIRENFYKQVQKLPSRMVLWLVLLVLFVYLRFVVTPVVESQAATHSEILQISKSVRSETSLEQAIEELSKLKEQQQPKLKALEQYLYSGAESQLKIDIAKLIEEYSEQRNIKLIRTSWGRAKDDAQSVKTLEYKIIMRLDSNQFVEFLQYVEYHEPLFYVSDLRVTAKGLSGHVQMAASITIPFYEKAK